MIVKSVEKKDNSTATFQVEISKEEFELAVNNVYQRSRKNINVPGFRKGKAPRAVIESMYGKSVFYDDAASDLASPAFEYAVEKEELKTVGRPSLSDVDVSEEQVLTLSFETGLYPVATLGQYKGLEAPKDPTEVTDEDIEAELKKTQVRNSRMETVDRPAKDGDIAVIDFEGFLDGVAFEGGKGEGHHLILGSGEFIPGFEDQIIGMSAGEEKDLDITFPEDYRPSLAGKDVIFKTRLIEVKENIMPELDDEFAKDISEFDTLDEYKANLREELQKKKEAQSEEKYSDALLAKAVENMQVTIPDAMIEEQLDMLINDYAQNLAMQGYTLDQYLQQMGLNIDMFRMYSRPSAQRKISNELLLDLIVEAENFECTEEEIEAEYAKAAENFKIELEKAKELVDKEAIAHDIKFQKAAQIIYSTGIPTEPVKEEPQEAKAEETETAE